MGIDSEIGGLINKECIHIVIQSIQHTYSIVYKQIHLMLNEEVS
jgi:hypothetical protein